MEYRPTHSLLRAWFILLLLAITMPLLANPQTIPEPLKPWVEWVKNKDHACLTLPSGKATEKLCSIADSTQIKISANNIDFESNVLVLASDWIALPGDARHWPEQLSVNGESRIAVSRSGQPAIWLEPGNHSLNLKLKRDKNNRFKLPLNFVAFQVVDAKGEAITAFREKQSWLVFNDQKEQKQSSKTAADSVDIKVFRNLADGEWPVLQTRIELKIAGKERILNLPDAAYPQALPYRINSQLPHSIQPDGSLQLIAKPGAWHVDISARFTEPADQWELGKPSDTFWPSNEYWSISKSPLYLSEIESGTYAESSSLGVPNQWKNLPWYRMGETAEPLKISRKPNESSSVEPNTRIQRDVWLPLSGDEITVVDQITGELPGHLAMTGATPNAIYINEKPMPLLDLPEGIGTRFAGTHLDAKVIWNPESSLRTLNLETLPYENTGTESVDTRLHLPPGWTFLGTDSGHSYSGWFSSWNLLSFFLVLVTSLGIYKLVGRMVGIIAFVLLTIGHGVILVSSVAWLVAAGIAALLPRLTQSRWKKPLSAVLVLILVGACVDIFTNTREAIHPELSWTANYESPYGHRAKAVSSMPEPMVMEDAEISESVYALKESRAYQSLPTPSAPPTPKKIELVDDDLTRAVGKTAPLWRGHTIHISQGITELNKETPTTIYLLPPVLSSVYHLLIAGLVLALAALILLKAFKLRASPSAIKKALTISALLLLSSNASANFPSTELLEELREQVNQTEPCFPNCASLISVKASIDDQDSVKLDAVLFITSDKPALVPLLRNPDFSAITVLDSQFENRRPAKLSLHQSNVWVQAPPGEAQVTIRLKTAGQKTNLQLATHRSAVSIQSNADWKLSVSHQTENTATLLIQNLKLGSATTQTNALTLPPSQYETLYDLDRELVMTNQWALSSSIRILSAKAAKQMVQVPKVKNERLITEHPDIKDQGDHYEITLRNRQRLSWDSTLEPIDFLELPVAKHPLKTQWSIRHTPSWIIESETHHQTRSVNNGELKTFVAPAGKNIEISARKPRGIEGASIAIGSIKTTNEVATDIVTTSAVIEGETSKPKTIVLKPSAGGEVKYIHWNSTPVSVDSSKTKDGYRIPLPTGAFTLEIKNEDFRSFELVEILRGYELYDEAGNRLLPGTSTMTANISNRHWIWHTSSAGVGPVVVFWGILLPVLVFAVLLGMGKVGQRGIITWTLLLLGLTYATPVSLWLAVSATVVFVAWVLLLDYRNKHPVQRLGSTRMENSQFTLKQTGYVLFAIIAAGILLEAVANGLIGNSQTQILGNASNRSMMQWVNDGAYNDVTIYSLPVLIYRGLIMVWAIWLAVLVGTKFGPYAWSGFNNIRDLREKAPMEKS